MKYISFWILVLLLAGAGIYYIWGPGPVSVRVINESGPNESEKPYLGSANSGYFEAKDVGQQKPLAQQKNVHVILPNGGEVWEKGRQYNIKWTTTLIAPETLVYVSLIKTASVIVDPYAVRPSRITGYEIFHPSIYPHGLPKEGSFTYKVPDTLPSGTYQLLVWAGQNCSVALPKSKCQFDLSDKLFTVR